MTIQALPTPTAAPAVSEASAHLARAHEVALERVHRDELGQLLTTLATLESQTEALRLKVLAEAERRQVAADQAATGTDAWAAALTGTTREVNAGGLHLAELLKTKYHHTREAYAAGQLRADQVRVIVRAAEQAPLDTTVRAARRRRGGPGQQGHRHRHPVGAPDERQTTAPGSPADARHRRPRPGRQATKRSCSGANPGARSTRPTWRCTTTATAPTPGSSPSPSCTAPCYAPPSRPSPHPDASTRPSTSPDGESVSGYDESAPTGPDHGLSGWEIHGNALCELIEHLPTDGWNGANALTLLVTMTAEDLTHDLTQAGKLDPASWPDWHGPDETGTAKLDTGTRTAAGDLRRLACEAGLVPAVLGSRPGTNDSVPLDLGRTRRLHSHHQRKALALVHDTCAIGTCERPFAWSEIHHLIPWSHHGDTDLEAIPLCSWHHHRAHDPRWHLTQHPLRGWELRSRRRKRS